MVLDGATEMGEELTSEFGLVGATLPALPHPIHRASQLGLAQAQKPPGNASWAGCLSLDGGTARIPDGVQRWEGPFAQQGQQHQPTLAGLESRLDGRPPGSENNSLARRQGQTDMPRGLSGCS